MDETKQTEGLPLEGKAPEGSEGITPNVEAKTQYTQEELNKAIQADRIARGRDAAKLTQWETDLKAQQAEIDNTKAELTKIQEQIDQAELEAARGDPAKLKELQAKKSYKTLLTELDTKKKELQKERQSFERDKAEHAEKVRAAEEVTLGMKLYEIAAKYDLNPEDLKKDMKDLNLTTETQLEAYAKRISKGERLPEGEEKKPSTPVSVPTSGGAKTPSGDPLSNFFRDKNK